MDTFTEMQSSLKKANKILDQVYDSLSEYNAEKKDVVIDFNKLKALASNSLLNGHRLSYAGVKREYLILLAMENLLEQENQDAGWLYIQRIICAACPDDELSSIVSDAMSVSEEQTIKFIDIVKEQKLVNVFVLDSIILHKVCNNENRKVLEFLADLYELLSITPDVLSEGLALTKLILENDSEKYFEEFRNWKAFAAAEHICYMYKVDGLIFDDIYKAKSCNSDKVIITSATIEHNETLNLDEWNANEILFFGVTFKMIQGIISKHKKVSFERCVFQGNITQVKKETGTGLFGGTFVKYQTAPEVHEAYLETNCCFIIHSHFTKFKDGISYIKIGKGSISDSCFENCDVDGENYKNLIDLADGKVQGCKFSNCHSVHNYSEANQAKSAFIRVSNSEIKECSFEHCSDYVSSNYGRFVNYYTYLIEAYRSNVENCSFKSCVCDGKSDSDKTQYAHMICLNESRESNNTFENCKCPCNWSYHYQGDNFFIGDGK